MEKGFFLTDLKQAVVIPIFRKGEVEGTNNYSPISILLTLTELAE